MNKQNLYTKLIHINNQYSMQIDKENNQILNIYHNNILINRFKLNRKIYTLFKIIQEYTLDEDYIIIEDNQAKIYGKPINLYDNVYMQINPDRACLTLDFYKLTNNKKELVYLTKLIYTTQKLFCMINIPYKLDTNKNYYINNIFKFLDMIEILGYEKENKLNNNNGD